MISEHIGYVYLVRPLRVGSESPRPNTGLTALGTITIFFVCFDARHSRSQFYSTNPIVKFKTQKKTYTLLSLPHDHRTHLSLAELRALSCDALQRLVPVYTRTTHIRNTSVLMSSASYPHSYSKLKAPRGSWPGLENMILAAAESLLANPGLCFLKYLSLHR